MKTKLFAAVLIVVMTDVSSFARAAGSSITTVISSEDSYVDSARPTANFGGCNKIYKIIETNVPWLIIIFPCVLLAGARLRI